MNQQLKPGRGAVWNGFFGGAAIGIIFGLLVSGPNFHSWPAVEILKITIGCMAAGAFIGAMIIPLLISSLAKGPGVGLGDQRGDGTSNSEGHGNDLLIQLNDVSQDNNQSSGPGDYPGP